MFAKGPLSRVAMGLGLAGWALVAFVVASIFGLTGHVGTSIPVSGGGALSPILIAPFISLVGMAVAFVAKRREGGRGAGLALGVNAGVIVVTALLVLIAVV
jgi:hypothetical protein